MAGRILILALLALAACGVDGVPHHSKAETTGVTVTGEASFGLSGSL